MTDSVLLAEQKGATLWLTLNRPKAMNTLSYELMAGLLEAIEGAKHNETIRSVVLTGSGKAFCAGADLKSLEIPREKGQQDFLFHVFELFKALRDFEKPLIAAVNGLACGGGLELAVHCDLIFAADSATIGDAHANYGLVPGGGGAAYLPRIIPLPLAKFLMFTGRFVPAAKLMDYGLLNEVYPDDALLSEVELIANEINGKSPCGIARMKRIANGSMDKSLEDSMMEEFLATRDQFRSWDCHEGVAAFYEKRKPEFKGC